jgi:hypothetical protein
MVMKTLYKLCIVTALLIASATFATALTTPYSLSGHIYDTDGTTPIVGANITFTNQNSSEVIYCDSTSGGEYQQDAANFASGYYDGDTIRYESTYNTQNNTTTAAIVVSNGGTALDIVLSAGATPTPVPSSDTGAAIDALGVILIFLVLLVIDFAIVFYVFYEVRTVFYSDAGFSVGTIVFSFLGFTLSFILASLSLAAPIEMPELNYFMLSIAIVMLIVSVTLYNRWKNQNIRLHV